MWSGGTKGEPELLASCYRATLALAVEHGIRSIAFPAISCGVYGYPFEEATAIAVRECRAFVAMHDEIERVVFALFNRELLSLYERELERTAPRPTTRP